MQRIWFVVALGLVAVPPLWADCLGGYRDTTLAEKAAWDRVSRVFPKLVHVPSGYALKKSELSVSRKGRCVGGGNDPIYLPVHMRFEIQDEARRKLEEDIRALREEEEAVFAKYRPRFMALQREQQALLSSGQIMDKVIQQKLQVLARKGEVLNQEQQRELAPYRMREKRLLARARIRVDAYFNNETSECKGKPVDLSGVTAACINRFEDGSTLLTVLLGRWQRNESGWWKALYDRKKPTHALQVLAISVSAADGVDPTTMVDWKAAAALLKREGQ